MEQSVGKRLKEYTASAINTAGAVYQKIMANEAAERNNQAAIEKQLNDLFRFLEAYRQPDIFSQDGFHQLKSLNFFSGLRKQKQELLSSLAHKYRAMMLRNEGQLDTVWGTKWNIEHALRLFFNNTRCFVMEHTNEQKTNLLADEFTADMWLLNDEKISDTTAALSEESCLINVRGIELGGNMQLKTKEPIMLQKGLYSLHFFIRGKMMKDGKRSGAER